MGKIAARLLPFVIACMFLLAVPNVALSDKPPWAKDPHPDPTSVPEPVALTLIGMGASAALGFYLGRKKRNKKDSSENATNSTE
jgi:LPXTG-motif cell wall-anchored protein